MGYDGESAALFLLHLAPLGSVAGFGALALHLTFLLPALAVVLGTFALARRLCQSPATAAL